MAFAIQRVSSRLKFVQQGDAVTIGIRTAVIGHTAIIIPLEAVINTIRITVV